VQGEVGSNRLQPGTYRVKCTDAKVEAKEGTKNRAVVIELVDANGNGDIRVNFNVKHDSAKAQEIGLKQLKGFLEVGGHANPDRPGDIKSLVGLECAIAVGMGKPYRNQQGETVTRTEVKKFMAKDSPVAGPTPGGASAGAIRHADPARQAPSSRDIDDDIPF
jgi:hypothetical protein